MRSLAGGLYLFDRQTLIVTMLSSLVLLGLAQTATFLFLAYLAPLCGMTAWNLYLFEQTPNLTPRTKPGRERLRQVVDQLKNQRSAAILLDSKGYAIQRPESASVAWQYKTRAPTLTGACVQAVGSMRLKSKKGASIRPSSSDQRSGKLLSDGLESRSQGAPGEEGGLQGDSPACEMTSGSAPKDSAALSLKGRAAARASARHLEKEGTEKQLVGDSV